MMGTECQRFLPVLLLAPTPTPFFNNQFLSAEMNLSNVKPFSSAANLVLSEPRVATICVGECSSHHIT